MKVHQKRLLDKGKIEKLVAALRSLLPAHPQAAEKLHDEADYFEKNAERMRYPKFRRQHLFVGSGVIEAGCKTVIGSRLKQSGMFWTVRGANAMLALRTNRLSGRFSSASRQKKVLGNSGNCVQRICALKALSMPPEKSCSQAKMPASTALATGSRSRPAFL